MRYRLLFVITILWLVNSNVFAKKNDFQIQNGILDLKLTNIEEIQSIKLQGEMEFYWNQLLEPKDFDNSENKLTPTFEKIPKGWTSYKIDSAKLPNKGYATYRLIINKKPDTTETIYGLKIFTIFSNYKLWVNNVLLTEVGNVDKTEAISIPKFKFQDIPFNVD